MYSKAYAQPLFRAIASTLAAINNCRKNGDLAWLEKHESDLAWMEDQLPHGGGIDCGCKIDRERSNDKRLLITFSFHHMDENGYYGGWSDYKLTIRPSLQFGHELKIAGRDRNGIKDYLYDTFDHMLQAKVWQEFDGTRVNGLYHRESVES